jgi:hypothetical protein
MVMKSWQKLMATGLVGMIVAVGCTVTSSDDVGSAGAGGEPAATGGAGGSTGGTAGSTGGVQATGGSAGAAPIVDCGLQNATDECANALRANCCTEFGACSEVGDCLTEWAAAQTCMIATTDDAGTITEEQVDQCFSDSAVAGGGMVTSELNALMGCVNGLSATSVPCTGFDVLIAPGAGGAGGGG